MPFLLNLHSFRTALLFLSLNFHLSRYFFLNIHIFGDIITMQTGRRSDLPNRQAPRPSTISPVCGCSSRTLVSVSTASGLYALLYHVPSFAVVVPHIHASCGCWCPCQREREFRKPPLMRAVTRTSLIANVSPPFQRPRTVGILRFAVSPASAPTPPRQ